MARTWRIDCPRTSRIGAALLVIVMPACAGPDGRAPEPPISNAAAASTRPGQTARAASLFATIRSAGLDCAGVTEAFLQGVREGGEVWNARCGDGPSYAVVSKPGVGTDVVTCDAIEAETGTGCFRAF